MGLYKRSQISQHCLGAQKRREPRLDFHSNLKLRLLRPCPWHSVEKSAVSLWNFGPRHKVGLRCEELAAIEEDVVYRSSVSRGSGSVRVYRARQLSDVIGVSHPSRAYLASVAVDDIQGCWAGQSSSHLPRGVQRLYNHCWVMSIRSIFLLLPGISLTQAFAPIAPFGTVSHKATTTRLRLTPLSEGMEASRSAFFIWFFGASGAAGIARSAFPRMYQAVQEVQQLKGLGPTLGGETIGLSPLCGYPEDLRRADVEKILNNPLSVEQLVEKYPVENNFLSKKGYLTFPAFSQANADANPLAVRAVFDSFAQSTDAVNPNVAQAKMDSYRKDTNNLLQALLYSKFVGWAAIVTLLFLLGLADVVAFGHAYDGWFPDWPGGRNFPACMIDPATGPWTIPDYWVS